MILSNYKKYMQGICALSYNSGSTGVNTGVVDMDGNPTSIWTHASSGDFYISNLSIFRSSGIFVGSGDTEVREDDYSLANLIPDSTLANVTKPDQPTMSMDENGNLIGLFTYSASNLTGETITIKEVGIVKYNYSKDNTNYNSVLFARKLLDEPIVVPNNTTFNIAFNWTQS